MLGKLVTEYTSQPRKKLKTSMTLNCLFTIQMRHLVPDIV